VRQGTPCPPGQLGAVGPDHDGSGMRIELVLESQSRRVFFPTSTWSERSKGASIHGDSRAAGRACPCHHAFTCATLYGVRFMDLQFLRGGPPDLPLPESVWPHPATTRGYVVSPTVHHCYDFCIVLGNSFLFLFFASSWICVVDVY